MPKPEDIDSSTVEKFQGEGFLIVGETHLRDQNNPEVEESLLAELGEYDILVLEADPSNEPYPIHSYSYLAMQKYPAKTLFFDKVLEKKGYTGLTSMFPKDLLTRESQAVLGILERLFAAIVTDQDVEEVKSEYYLKFPRTKIVEQIFILMETESGKERLLKALLACREYSKIFRDLEYLDFMSFLAEKSKVAIVVGRNHLENMKRVIEGTVTMENFRSELRTSATMAAMRIQLVADLIDFN